MHAVLNLASGFAMSRDWPRDRPSNCPRDWPRDQGAETDADGSDEATRRAMLAAHKQETPLPRLWFMI